MAFKEKQYPDSKKHFFNFLKKRMEKQGNGAPQGPEAVYAGPPVEEEPPVEEVYAGPAFFGEPEEPDEAPAAEELPEPDTKAEEELPEPAPEIEEVPPVALVYAGPARFARPAYPEQKSETKEFPPVPFEAVYAGPEYFNPSNRGTPSKGAPRYDA